MASPGQKAYNNDLLWFDIDQNGVYQTDIYNCFSSPIYGEFYKGDEYWFH